MAGGMAAHNPNAIYRKPITIDDYLASRMISTPLRLFDCDSHIDGSTAILLSHKDAAKDLRESADRDRGDGHVDRRPSARACTTATSP